MQNREHNFLLLVWKDPVTRRNYTIGKLTHSEKYFFEYCGEYDEAEKKGCRTLEAFPEKRTYESDELFLTFSSRLPDKKRRDIVAILNKYGLDAYDEFELLRKSGARLPIDTYEFVDPIFPEDETIQRDFYVMGIRHVSECGGEECYKLPPISIGDYLELVREPENAEDAYALRIDTLDGKHVGYVPRYFSKGIIMRLGEKVNYSCKILEINQDGPCAECVKVRLNIPSEE